ncbi:MAG: hypothetical protein J7642_21390 [Cyanobacteria bacterium SBC]|nr:hypothetical protein [Cyanobacteria bacterium SBC]
MSIQPTITSNRQPIASKFAISIGALTLNANTVRSIGRFRESPEFAELPYWRGQPVLHSTGTELAEWSASFYLHSDFVEVDRIVADLLELERQAEPIEVTYNSTFDGEYVIEVEVKERRRNRGVLIVEVDVDFQGTTQPQNRKVPIDKGLQFASPWKSAAKKGSELAGKLRR